MQEQDGPVHARESREAWQLSALRKVKPEEAGERVWRVATERFAFHKASLLVERDGSGEV